MAVDQLGQAAQVPVNLPEFRMNFQVAISLIPEENSQAPQTPEAVPVLTPGTSSLHMNFPTCCLQVIHRTGHVFLSQSWPHFTLSYPFAYS